jgi:hypothetical protein
MISVAPYAVYVSAVLPPNFLISCAALIFGAMEDCGFEFPSARSGVTGGIPVASSLYSGSARRVAVVAKVRGVNRGAVLRVFGEINIVF